MRHHQKYFSVEDAEGKLAPQFVAVMNIPSDPESFVRSGNERVLRARFNDARFFWETDQKKKLIHRSRICPTSPSKPNSVPISKRPTAPSPSPLNWVATDSRSAPRKCSSATSPPNSSKSSPNCRAWWAGSTPARRANPTPYGRRSTTNTNRPAWKTRFRAPHGANRIARR